MLNSLVYNPWFCNDSIIKRLNNFFKTAVKKEVVSLKDELLLSPIQEQIFDMKYLQRQDTGFIADTLGYSKEKIDDDLKVIRIKLSKVIH